MEKLFVKTTKTTLIIFLLFAVISFYNQPIVNVFNKIAFLVWRTGLIGTNLRFGVNLKDQNETFKN